MGCSVGTKLYRMQIMLDDSEKPGSTYIPEEDPVVLQAVWEYISVHYDSLFRIAMSAARGDAALAEELMSDEIYRQLPVLVVRWDRQRPFQNYVNLYFYRHLRKIVARKYHASRRELSVEETASSLEYSSSGSKCFAFVEQNRSLEVNELLSRLEPQERVAVVMSKMFEYTYREIAEKLGVSVGKVTSLVNGALAKMRSNND